jgi:hypothetical protein
MVCELHFEIVMKSSFQRIRSVPFFPFVPVVPLLLATGLIALEAFTLLRLRAIGRKLDSLAEAQPPLLAS